MPWSDYQLYKEVRPARPDAEWQCVWCKEFILARALVCKHCHRDQSQFYLQRRRQWAPQYALTPMGTVLAMGGAGVGLLYLVSLFVR